METIEEVPEEVQSLVQNNEDMKEELQTEITEGTNEPEIEGTSAQASKADIEPHIMLPSVSVTESQNENLVQTSAITDSKSELKELEELENEEQVLDLITTVPTEQYLQEVEDLDQDRPSHNKMGHKINFINSFPFASLGHDSSRTLPSTPPPTPIKGTDAVLVFQSQLSLEFFTKLRKAVTPQSAEPEVYDMGTLRASIMSEAKKVARFGSLKKLGLRIDSLDTGYSETESDDFVEKSRLSEEREQERQAECRSYSGIHNFATGFVDDIIDKSVTLIADSKLLIHGEYSQSDEETLSSLRTYVEVFGNFTRWPRIQGFSKELGQTTINEYILTWNYVEDWLYCVDFVVEQSDECSDYYLYETKWSIPSKPYPIPQATASIYFTIEVSRVKPPFCPVDVTYVFEGSKFVHTPGKIQFQEQWLFDIIDAKINLFKRIRF